MTIRTSGIGIGQYVEKTGDTMTGSLTLSSGNLTLTTGNIVVTGGTLTMTGGNLNMNNNIISNAHVRTLTLVHEDFCVRDVADENLKMTGGDSIGCGGTILLRGRSFPSYQGEVRLIIGDYTGGASPDSKMVIYYNTNATTTKIFQVGKTGNIEVCGNISCGSVSSPSGNMLSLFDNIAVNTDANQLRYDFTKKGIILYHSATTGKVIDLKSTMVFNYNTITFKTDANGTRATDSVGFFGWHDDYASVAEGVDLCFNASTDGFFQTVAGGSGTTSAVTWVHTTEAEWQMNWKLNSVVCKKDGTTIDTITANVPTGYIIAGLSLATVGASTARNYTIYDLVLSA